MEPQQSRFRLEKGTDFTVLFFAGPKKLYQRLHHAPGPMGQKDNAMSLTMRLPKVNPDYPTIPRLLMTMLSRLEVFNKEFTREDDHFIITPYITSEFLILVVNDAGAEHTPEIEADEEKGTPARDAGLVAMLSFARGKWRVSVDDQYLSNDPERHLSLLYMYADDANNPTLKELRGLLEAMMLNPED